MRCAEEPADAVCARPFPATPSILHFNANDQRIKRTGNVSRIREGFGKMGRFGKIRFSDCPIFATNLRTGAETLATAV
jgi:hypothetical protein